LAFAQSGRDPKSWSLLPKAMARGDAGALAGLSPAQAVDALQKLCHDLLAVKAGAPPRFFDAAELPPAPDLGPLGAWGRELVRTARTVEHPFNPGLMLESLAAQAHRAIRLP
jgi:DNA polymerase-3 subunit delta'